MRVETHPHEAGFGSNRVSAARGEYVPAPCTHRPSKHPSGVRMRPPSDGRIWAPQGGLSRNKVAVGESAAGSPPTDRDFPHGKPTAEKTTLSKARYGSATRSAGHLRPTEAHITPHSPSVPSRDRARSSAVEHLLCKEDALGSNPSGSMPTHSHARTARLKCTTAFD